jgi:hypothetical protein
VIHDGACQRSCSINQRVAGRACHLAYAPASSSALVISMAINSRQRGWSALGGQGVTCADRCAAKRKCQRQGGLKCSWPQCPEPSTNPRGTTSAIIDWQKAMPAELGRSWCCVRFGTLRS